MRRLLRRMRIDSVVCRSASCTLILALAATVAVAGSNSPLEYVDEQTGATVIAVIRPLLFAHLRSETITGPRDYVTLAAAAVDRSGKYSYMLLAYFWFVGAPEESESTRSACPPLALQVQDGRIDLPSPPDGSARDVGIGVAVHKPPFGATTPCAYSVDLSTMRRIAESPHPVLYSEGTSASQQYNLFEDRLDALKELVRRLKDTS